jgi:hypothetical protein
MTFRVIRSRRRRLTARGELFDQMELPSFLALNASDRAFGRFHIGLSIKSYPDGKLPGLVASNDLNARDGLATGPLSDGLKALFPEGPVPQADCFEFRHGARRLREQHRRDLRLLLTPAAR